MLSCPAHENARDCLKSSKLQQATSRAHTLPGILARIWTQHRGQQIRWGIGGS